MTPYPKPALALALFLVPALFADPALAQMDMSGMDMSKHKPAAADGPAPQPHSDWQIHFHSTLNLIAVDQQGPRGGSKTFAAGMVMLMASRPLSSQTTLQLNAMASPDPWMGPRGYPLLLQSGETADGIDHLVDRQHPHDLLMGLTARVTHRFDDGSSAFAEIGYPGEIAFGPEAFMHRPSGEAFPTAPISHHWLDSGHITMGELTAGYVRGPVTLELSRFTGREPDQDRYDLDPIRIDSTSVRATWTLNRDWSAQASWARQVSPEQLEPDVNLRKMSLSASYRHTYDLGRLDSTFAWATKTAEHSADKASDAWLFENTMTFNPRWQVLARFERVYNSELVPGSHWVAKSEFGVVRTFQLNDRTQLGLGLVRQIGDVPKALEPAYGRHPDGTVAFVQLKFHAMKM